MLFRSIKYNLAIIAQDAFLACNYMSAYGLFDETGTINATLNIIRNSA